MIVRFTFKSAECTERETVLFLFILCDERSRLLRETLLLSVVEKLIRESDIEWILYEKVLKLSWS